MLILLLTFCCDIPLSLRCGARPSVVFPDEEQSSLIAGIIFYCLATEASLILLGIERHDQHGQLKSGG